MSSPSFASPSTPAAADERVPMARVWRVGAQAIGAAVVATLVVWVIAHALFDIPDAFAPLATPWPTIISTVVALAIGVGVFALLLSFINVVTVARGQDGSTTAGLWTLAVMHVVAFAVFFPLITTRTRDG